MQKLSLKNTALISFFHSRKAIGKKGNFKRDKIIFAFCYGNSLTKGELFKILPICERALRG